MRYLITVGTTKILTDKDTAVAFVLMIDRMILVEGNAWDKETEPLTRSNYDTVTVAYTKRPFEETSNGS